MRTKHCLTAADAQKMMAACKAEAEKNGWKVTIAIVDDGAHLLHLERMDGAGLHTVEIAMGKAQTSAFSKTPTKVAEDIIKERPALLSFPNRVAVQGAVPLLYQGECVGAIGVSGVKSHEDEQVALAGAAVLA